MVRVSRSPLTEIVGNYLASSARAAWAPRAAQTPSTASTGEAGLDRRSFMQESYLFLVLSWRFARRPDRTPSLT